MTVSDGDGGTATDRVVIVVYDPDVGHLTGGRDIDSPAAACVADPLLEDRAHLISRRSTGRTRRSRRGT